MRRRNLLAGLAALPFFRWLKPSPPAPLEFGSAVPFTGKLEAISSFGDPERLFSGSIGRYYGVRFIEPLFDPKCAPHSREEDYGRMEVIHFQYGDMDPWADDDDEYDEEAA